MGSSAEAEVTAPFLLISAQNPARLWCEVYSLHEQTTPRQEEPEWHKDEMVMLGVQGAQVPGHKFLGEQNLFLQE